MQTGILVNTCNFALTLGLLSIDLTFLILDRTKNRWVIPIFVFAMVLTLMDMVGNFLPDIFHTIGVSVVERLVRLCCMTFIVLYPSEIQKIFSVIDPYWTHERIRIFQWTFVFLMFALQLPVIIMFAIDDAYFQNITIWLSIMWAALQGVIGPTLCIRTCYMVYKFTFQTIYPPNVKKQVMGQFYKCLQLLVPIVLFILSAVLIYIFQVGGVYKDQDSILGSMTQSFIIWSFCLYYRLFIECKRLVQLGLDIQSTHSDLKTDLSFQRTKAAPQSQEVL